MMIQTYFSFLQFFSQNLAYYMHNVVHRFFIGQVSDVSTSPSDPLFWLHHCFVDKLFDIWMRKKKLLTPKMPIIARPGHGGDDPVVPFFPAEQVRTYFVPVSELGITFEDDYRSVGIKEQVSG